MQTNEKIVALGVGRKGCQIVEQMPGKIEGVEFVSVNDADECKKIIHENFLNSDVIFVIGDSPLISDMAKAAKEAGKLTIGIALTNNEKLNAAFKEASDALILFDENISWDEQIKRSQNVVETIADLITKSGFVNLDFEDIKAILQNTGTAFLGMGHAEGDGRAKIAALQAVNTCGEVKNAKRILLNITTGSEVGLGEMSDAAQIVEEVCAPEAQIIWGHIIDDEMGDDLQVAFIAGMDDKNKVERSFSMQEPKDLLQEVSRLSEEFYATHEKKGMIERFNVFKILDVETDERKICRFLCGILSPAEALGNGFLSREFFLKSFVKKVLKLDIPDYKLEKAEVCREYLTENGRKIDIVIRSKAFRLFIPIEVKIWAWDLNRQCRDYYDEAKKHDADAKIFYLTPNGKLPSPESADGVPTENMKCISFENDIYDWISYCICQSEVIRNAPLREVLLQFAATVKKFTEQTMEEQLKMEIAELIGKSTENLKAAGEIISALGTALQTRLFESVERILEKEYKPENIDFYYKNQSKGAQGLFYHNREHDNATPGVRFDVEYWYGALWAFIGEFTLQGSKWGNYDKCGVNGHYVDFSNIDHLCELCDEENMKKFAGNCAEKIMAYLENINSSQQNA